MHALARLWGSAVFMTLHGPVWAADFELDLEPLKELSPRPGSVVNADRVIDHRHHRKPLHKRAATVCGESA